jgi:alkaline phosphatase isozyme conversion protein
MNKSTRHRLLLGVCLLILPACGLWGADIPLPTASPVVRVTVNPPTQVPMPTLAMANGLVARQHIVALSETIGPRVAGTPGETKAAEYIEAAFKAYGYVTELQVFSFTTEDDDEETTLNSANVIAVKTGMSPRELIVGAHYDSIGAGEGADDNASGVAVMLEVAEKVKDIQTPYTIRFVAFGAEEVDLDGSRYYVGQMGASDVQNTVGMINLDSLIAGDIAYVYGDAGPAGVVRDWILEFAQSRGFDVETQPGDSLDEPDGTPCDCADYGPFEEAGIPFAYFEATNWNLGEEDGLTQVDPEFGEEGEIRHAEYDNLSYIDESFPERVNGHSGLFVTLLYGILTEFKLPD